MGTTGVYVGYYGNARIDKNINIENGYSSSYCDFSSLIARFVEDWERECSPDTDKELDQLLSSLLLDLALDMLSKSAPPTQP